MIAVSDANLLYQQMGEVLTRLRILGDVLTAQDDEAKKNRDTIRGEIAKLGGEQRRQEEKFMGSVRAIEAELEKLRGSTGDAAAIITGLASAIQDIRGSVSELASLRAKIGGAVVGLGFIGSMAIWFAEPIYRWAIDHLFSRTWGAS